MKARKPSAEEITAFVASLSRDQAAELVSMLFNRLRQEQVSPKRRSEIARTAANARWGRRKESRKRG